MKIEYRYGNKRHSHPIFMKRGKKLYYAPGVISLIGIWSFYFHFQNRFKSRPETSLIINVPKENNNYFQYSTGYFKKLIASKKQIKLELNEDRETNQKKIEFIKYEARKIKYTKDTNSVISISLTNETTYGEFVKLLNLCYADDHKLFVLFKKSFLIFGEYPPTPKDTTKEIKLMTL